MTTDGSYKSYCRYVNYFLKLSNKSHSPTLLHRTVNPLKYLSILSDISIESISNYLSIQVFQNTSIHWKNKCLKDIKYFEKLKKRQIDDAISERISIQVSENFEYVSSLEREKTTGGLIIGFKILLSVRDTTRQIE